MVEDSPSEKAASVVAPPAGPSRDAQQTPPQMLPGDNLGEKAQIAYMWVGPALSFAVLAGFFVMLWSLLHIDATTMAKLGNVENVLFTLLGALGAAFTQVINYWLGSSKGSADKTSMLKGG